MHKGALHTILYSVRILPQSLLTALTLLSLYPKSSATMGGSQLSSIRFFWGGRLPNNYSVDCSSARVALLGIITGQSPPAREAAAHQVQGPECAAGHTQIHRCTEKGKRKKENPFVTRVTVFSNLDSPCSAEESGGIGGPQEARIVTERR